MTIPNPIASRLTPFQKTATTVFGEILHQHDILSPFDTKGEEQPTVWTSFNYGGRGYTLAVFPRDTNLREGPNLYECILQSEFRDEETLITSFANRLQRFLDGGPWELPNE